MEYTKQKPLLWISFSHDINTFRKHTMSWVWPIKMVIERLQSQVNLIYNESVDINGRAPDVGNDMVNNDDGDDEDWELYLAYRLVSVDMGILYIYLPFENGYE